MYYLRTVALVPLTCVLVLAGCHVSRVRESSPPDAEAGGSTSDRRTVEVVSLVGRPLYAEPVGDRGKLEADLAAARADLTADPNDPERIVWLARRLGYLWRMTEAVEVLTDGARRHPKDPRMYRHRGHRYISLRRFDDAISDLTQAASLMKGRANEIEPDGAPNERGIPLTTTGFNVWYHFGLAKYLKGDYAGALEGWDQAMMFTRGYDDNLVAVTAWGYMTLCRHGRFAQAARALDPIRPDMDIIENHAYHKILLMHKGLVSPDELLRGVDESSLDFATLGYGLGFWYLQKGDRAAATEIFERVERGPYWPAFGYIAAEVELARLYQRR